MSVLLTIISWDLDNTFQHSSRTQNANKIVILAISRQAKIASHHWHNMACLQQQQQQSNKVSFQLIACATFCQCLAPLATIINSPL